MVIGLPTLRRCVVTLAAVLAVASCGGDPFVRSSLSDATPSAAPAQVIEALPEPNEVGPGWQFPTKSMDYRIDFLGQLWEMPEHGIYYRCDDAKPLSAGAPELLADGPVTIGGRFLYKAGKGEHHPVDVTVFLASPRNSADRIGFARWAFTRCGRLEYDAIRVGAFARRR